MCLDAPWECRSVDTYYVATEAICQCHLSDAAPGAGATEDEMDIGYNDWTMYVRQCAP